MQIALDWVNVSDFGVVSIRTPSKSITTADCVLLFFDAAIVVMLQSSFFTRRTVRIAEINLGL
ncbi:hypothetical protein F8388_011277 [Cannabis sativa]|uniref:Uncharacterized protein n=1 Tax=Cannabis sativa TaxID=3483 RepID=A0A7J6EQD8_CANSA|nr:hypothetical protein F8388_011277 [Cannabis sativa]KAF4384497.1 hypothetical protein G4B88_007134 [Cannabis sativa]